MRGHRRRGPGGEGQMDMIFWTLVGLGAAALVARAAASREGALRAAVNGILGLAALLAVNISAKYTGVGLGFNVFNGLVAGILGIPGVVLLVLVQWVLT